MMGLADKFGSFMNSMRTRQNYRENKETLNLMREAFYAGAGSALDAADTLAAEEMYSEIERINSQQQEQQPNSLWNPKVSDKNMRRPK